MDTRWGQRAIIIRIPRALSMCWMELNGNNEPWKTHEEKRVKPDSLWTQKASWSKTAATQEHRLNRESFQKAKLSVECTSKTVSEVNRGCPGSLGAYPANPWAPVFTCAWQEQNFPMTERAALPMHNKWTSPRHSHDAAEIYGESPLQTQRTGGDDDWVDPFAVAHRT